MTRFIPREPQHLIRNFICDNERGNVLADMGIGKTGSTIEGFAELKLFGEANRMLVLAPKRVALSTWPDEVEKFRESFGHLSIAAAIGTPAQRLAALRRSPDILTINYDNVEWLIEQYGDQWPFDMVVADECFVAGTPVSTPRGSVAIETLKPGCIVDTSYGPKRVARVYEKSTESLVEVRLVNGTRIVCTPSHLFWTTSGWQEAQELGPSVFVHTTMPAMRGDIRDGAIKSDCRRVGQVLSERLQYEALDFKHADRETANTRRRDERMAKRKSVVERRRADARNDQGETECGATGSQSRARGQEGWQRARHESDRGTRVATHTAWVGVESADQNERRFGAQRADILQTGLRLAGVDDLLGGGRAGAQSRQNQSTGSEERNRLARVRVEGVSRIECRGRVPVWDIEVEDAHEYFAGGVLVHNCTRLKGLRISMQTAKRADGTEGKSFIAGQGAKRAKALGHIAHKYVRRWLNLTGSFAPNGLIDAWGQQWFVDGGRRLGNSFDAYAKRYFRMGWGSTREQQQLEILPYADKQIQALLAETSIRIDARDWFDLKEPVERHIMVDLPPKARQQYREMQRDLFTWINEHPLEAWNAGVKSQKCLQVASGSVWIDRAEQHWEPVHDEKIEALRSIVEETGGRPLLIAYQFKPDLARILKAFPRFKALESKAVQTDFEEGRLQGLVVHPKGAGHGLNLQKHCYTLVDYSSGFNLEEDDQVLGRIGPVRQAQIKSDKVVFRYRIIARDTVEEHAVLPALSRKLSAQEALKDAIKRLR